VAGTRVVVELIRTQNEHRLAKNRRAMTGFFVRVPPRRGPVE
jgi:hypothetical protein